MNVPAKRSRRKNAVIMAVFFAVIAFFIAAYRFFA